MITVNGKQLDISEIKLTSYLNENGYNPNWVVVELNGDILQKDKYDSVTLKENDVVEILVFMGGG